MERGVEDAAPYNKFVGSLYILNEKIGLGPGGIGGPRHTGCFTLERTG